MWLQSLNIIPVFSTSVQSIIKKTVTLHVVHVHHFAKIPAGAGECRRFFYRWVRSVVFWPWLAVRRLGSYTCISRSPSVCPYADSMPVSRCVVQNTPVTFFS